MTIINVTPHAITMQNRDGEVYSVPPSGIIISATPVEEAAGIGPGGVELVRTKFVVNASELNKLDIVESRFATCPHCGRTAEEIGVWDPDGKMSPSEVLNQGHPDPYGYPDPYQGPVIVGSIIAAQAFPGRVFAMVPVPGFERVPPDQKRMCDWKFTTF